MPCDDHDHDLDDCSGAYHDFCGDHGDDCTDPYALFLRPRIQGRGNDGQPLVGGTLSVYVAGTSTPLTTYTSPSLTVKNPWPVPLDSGGWADAWWSGPAKLVIADSLGNKIWTFDNYLGFGGFTCKRPSGASGMVLADVDDPTQGTLNDKLDVSGGLEKSVVTNETGAKMVQVSGQPILNELHSLETSVNEQFGDLSNTMNGGLANIVSNGVLNGAITVLQSSIISALRDVEAGKIILYPGYTIPILADGKPMGLELNGSWIYLSDYPRLLRVWCGPDLNATASCWYRINPDGTRNPDGPIIVLADFRGNYPRGWDNGAGVDPGRELGGWQAGSMPKHAHTIPALSGGAEVKEHDHEASTTPLLAQGPVAPADPAPGVGYQITDSSTLRTGMGGGGTFPVTIPQSTTEEAGNGAENLTRNVSVRFIVLT